MSSKPRIIAFYLPQFHSIPENDKWWLKGFTEWTNVKKAKPLFKGHCQPRVPLDNNYYDLRNPSTLPWQVGLAREYGVYGFCFYHYWFNGKLLLEKPIENFLSRKDLDLNFCLSWANEPWTRAWDGGDKNILMPQYYNGRQDIKGHFEYLLPFFLDKRYILINNKPLVLLYRSNNISYLDEMIQLWNDLAVKNGFDGIHLVETLNSFQKRKFSQITDSIVYMEPMYVFANKTPIERILFRIQYFCINGVKISYRKTLKKILKYEKLSTDAYAGLFIDWDNTARKKKGYTVLIGKDKPMHFKNFFKKLYVKALKKNSPFIFVNAWNEWGEGAYLEPDMENHFSYLEIIKSVLNDDSLYNIKKN
jgi:lipopolysaccharide biosynthesis protein